MTKQRSVTVDLKVANATLGDVFADMARLHLVHRPFAKAGRIIVLKCGGRTAYAVARGPAGIDKNTISLDSVTRERLGVRASETATFTIEKAGLVDEVRWAWNASDAMPRVAARLGALSVLLGLIGLLLGVISFVVTFFPQSQSS